MADGFLNVSAIAASQPFLIAAVGLLIGVMIVNGATDAPNAIAVCIASRALPTKTAVIMAAVCNLLGVMVATATQSSVAETVSAMVDFGPNRNLALIGLCAGMAAVVLWATAAWRFGIPTSESHALIAGLSGAAIAIRGGLQGICAAEWIKVLYGLPFSLGLGFLAAFLSTRGIRRILTRTDRRTANRAMRRAQIFGGAAMAFAHGAQDGQKFIGVCLLIFAFADAPQFSANKIPLTLATATALLMALGTALGGKRIIRTMGMRMAAPAPHEGFAADVSGAAAILGASALGLPISTTHVKTAAVMGAAAAGRIRAVNWSVAAELFWAWILTFPGCGAVGFLVTHIVLRSL
jgi:PiT family inorganic phosphate transporter